MGSRALLLDVLLAGIRDTSGQPLAGGTITSYDAGTTFPRSLYSDYKKQNVAVNPYTLDSNGRAQLYGDGLYKLLIKDSTGATVYTWDNVQLFYDPGPLIYCGAAAGSANAQTLVAAPAITNLDTGMMFSFKSVGTNSGAVTLNPNAIGAYAVKDAAGNALQAGDLITGCLYQVTFDGTNFLLNKAGFATKINQSEAGSLITTSSNVLVDYTGASVSVVTTAPSQNVIVTAQITISIAAAPVVQALMTIGADGVDQTPNVSWTNARNNNGGQDDTMFCQSIEQPALPGSHTYKIRWASPSAVPAWSASYRLGAIVLSV